MNLRPFQHDMARHVATHEYGAYFVPIGSGKTAAMIRGLFDYDRDAPVPRTLVVAPKEVARSTWPAEVAVWSHPSVEVRSNVELPPDLRIANIQDRTIDLLTMNYEQLPWLFKTFTSAKLRKLFDVLVYDELDKLKAHNSDRFKALKKRLSDFPRRYGMTGTPASENLLGLWAQIYAIDGGKTFGTSFAKWRNHFFESDYMGWVWTPKPNTEAALYEMLKPLVYRISREQTGVQMPARQVVTIPIEMDEGQWPAYRALERDLMVAVRNGEISFEEDADVIEVASRATLSTKLRQVVSGFAYRQASHEEPVRLSWRKRNVLREHLEALAVEGRQCLVAYWWKDEEKWLREMGIPIIADGGDIISRWNAREVPVLGIHPASAGHGLNLQLGGCAELWFMTLPWSLGLYEQTIGRIERSGGADRIRVTLPIAVGTIDETVVEALKGKRSVQDAFLRRFE